MMYNLSPSFSLSLPPLRLNFRHRVVYIQFLGTALVLASS